MFTDLADPGALFYVEEWLTEVELHRQIRSERFQGLISVMEAAGERPRFDVELVSQFYGLDYVDAVLRQEGS